MQVSARSLLAGAAACAVAACSSDPSAPADAASVNANVAAFTAEAVGQDIQFMHGPRGFWGFALRGGPGAFECDSFTGDHVTVERTCTFADSDGVAQSAYDSLATASATLHVSASGSFDRGEWGSSSFSRERDLTVTGLAGAETQRTWNGNGSGTMSASRVNDDGDTVRVEMTSSGSVTDLVIPVPRTDTSWPLGGTIAFTVTAAFTGGAHDGQSFTRDVTVTFDGTQYATVTVNGETFTVDLARRRCTGGGDHHGGRGHPGDREGEGGHDGTGEHE